MLYADACSYTLWSDGRCCSCWCFLVALVRVVVFRLVRQTGEPLCTIRVLFSCGCAWSHQFWGVRYLQRICATGEHWQASTIAVAALLRC